MKVLKYDRKNEKFVRKSYKSRERGPVFAHIQREDMLG